MQKLVIVFFKIIIHLNYQSCFVKYRIIKFNLHHHQAGSVHHRASWFSGVAPPPSWFSGTTTELVQWRRTTSSWFRLVGWAVHTILNRAK
jgi:hypothetical protein